MSKVTFLGGWGGFVNANLEKVEHFDFFLDPSVIIFVNHLHYSHRLQEPQDEGGLVHQHGPLPAGAHPALHHGAEEEPGQLGWMTRLFIKSEQERQHNYLKDRLYISVAIHHRPLAQGQALRPYHLPAPQLKARHQPAHPT